MTDDNSPALSAGQDDSPMLSSEVQKAHDLEIMDATRRYMFAMTQVLTEAQFTRLWQGDWDHSNLAVAREQARHTLRKLYGR